MKEPVDQPGSQLFVCRRKSRSDFKPCAFCGAPTSRVCDFELTARPDACPTCGGQLVRYVLPGGAGVYYGCSRDDDPAHYHLAMKTCDAPVCASCALSQPGDIDYCPTHRPDEATGSCRLSLGACRYCGGVATVQCAFPVIVNGTPGRCKTVMCSRHALIYGNRTKYCRPHHTMTARNRSDETK